MRKKNIYTTLSDDKPNNNLYMRAYGHGVGIINPPVQLADNDDVFLADNDGVPLFDNVVIHE